MSMAATYASNVSDMLADGATAEETAAASVVAATSGLSGDAATTSAAVAIATAAASATGTAMNAVGAPALRAIEKARKAVAPPSHVFPLTSTTKLTFAPSIHTDAFEISDTTGFFGFTSKLLVRATSPEDMVDWILACNGVIDLVNLGTAAASTGGEP
jgi:hypothetical protein